jgi:hypothetical protein
MVVAILAVVLAAGGVGYAATKINGKNLKNHSVSGKKLKKNTLTGRQIKESKLGKVPSASAADTAAHASLADAATNAGHASTADTATNAGHATSAGSVATVSFHATKNVPAAPDFASAPQVPLGQNGPFSFYGKCFVTGTSVEAITYIASTSETGMFDTEAEDSDYVTPSTPEANRELQNVTATANTFDPGDGDKDFMATDGHTTIYGLVGLAAAKAGDPPAGDGPFGPGDRCLFGEAIFG